MGNMQIGDLETTYAIITIMMTLGDKLGKVQGRSEESYLCAVLEIKEMAPPPP